MSEKNLKRLKELIIDMSTIGVGVAFGFVLTILIMKLIDLIL